MIIFSLNFTLFMYLFELSNVILKFKYLLLILISLEFIIFPLNLLIFYIFSFYIDNYFGLVFVSIIVCEGVLGLSILVLILRSFGNVFLNL